MSSYKLTYFNIYGLAEPIRFLFNYGGINFIDERMTEEDWLRLKPTMPFGQVPVLEVNGKKINQSTAICRYLAKQVGLTGQDDWENLEIDAVVDTISDLRVKINAAHYEKNAESKAQKLAVAKSTTDLVIDRLNDRVAKNKGHLVNGKLTWADLYFVAQLDLLNARAARDILENAKNLQELRDKVLALPKIKAWIEKRPKSDY
ncbi:glutathione S-transferase-like [Trichogramma pretiosum]|uniref:glutathione S-transferase-like n=1 Tax=Trichogramma pretiosum TaxID=7493 RepID=UPI0006C9AC04|nr:glutathione S-transferase-like [Trichogramma pretiosum]